MNSHLPKEWTVARLGELATAIQYGYTEKARQEQVGPRFLRITDIQDDSVDWNQVPFCIIGDEDKEKYLLRKDDLVFARTGATVGKSFLITGSIPASVFASYLIRVRLQPDIEPKYVSYFFRSADYWRQISASQAGIGQPNVNGKKLAQIEIPIAPQDQQKQIVAEIEKQFSRLDEAVVNLKRIKANLKRYKAAVLKAAVEGKLTEAWRKAHPHVEPASKLLERILIERRAKWSGRGKFKEPTISETNDLPLLPKSWTWATVDQLAAPEPNSITDGPFGSNLKTEHYQETGPRVIRLQNIGDGVFVNEKAHITEEHFARLKKHQIFSGDLVIAALGENLPRSCLIPGSVGNAIVKADCIRFKPYKHALALYLNITLNAEPMRQRTKSIVHGVGRPRLNLGEIKSIVVPLPSISEQQAIVAEVERRLSVIDELETTVEANLTRADRLRQSILSQAFSGRLVVQDGKDRRGMEPQAYSLAAESQACYENDTRERR